MPSHREPCPFCPVEVRDLTATASNCVMAIDMARAGTGSWDRANRKIAALNRSALRLIGRRTYDEVTMLATVAWRFCWAAFRTPDSDKIDAPWFEERLADLRAASARCKPLVDRHFAECAPFEAVPYDAPPILPAGASPAAPAPAPLHLNRLWLFVIAACIVVNVFFAVFGGDLFHLGLAFLGAFVLAGSLGFEAYRSTPAE